MAHLTGEWFTVTRPGNDSILLFHPMHGSCGSTVAPGIPLSLLTVAAPLAEAREIEKGETKRGTKAKEKVRASTTDPEARVMKHEAKETYRQRERWSEFVNAWIKEKMGLRKFHLRGEGKALMELLWVCVTYNVKQWIRRRRRNNMVKVSAA